MSSDLRISLRIGGMVENTFKTAFGGAEKTVLKLGQTTEMLGHRQQRLGNIMSRSMSRSHADLGKMRREYENIGSAMRRAAKAQELINRNVRIGNALNDKRSDIFGKMGGLTAQGTGVGLPIIGAVREAIRFESAMADVKKVVNFTNPDGFKKLGDDLLRLSETIPLSVNELAGITASGGQLGVLEKDLLGFTETISKMSVAFDVSADVAGDSMAKIANVYQIPITQLGTLGDAINELSNTSAAKASDIVDVLGRIGGVSKQFGLTATQSSSLSSSLIALGKSPEVAGTAINSMLTKIKLLGDGIGDKKGMRALQQMGLDAKTLGKNINQDAEAALVSFLKRIGSLSKDKQLGVLVDLFGSEFADDVSLLAGSLNSYTSAIGTLNSKDSNDKLNFIGSMGREFDSRSSTTENQLTLFKNNIAGLGIAIGNVLLPPLNDMLTAMKPVIKSFEIWAKENPDVVKSVIALAGGLLLGKMAFFGIALGVNTVRTGINGISFAFNVLRGKVAVFQILGRYAPMITRTGKAVRYAGTAVSFLGRMFMLNPIGLAIGVIAGGAYLIYRNWQPIKGFFTGLWSQLQTDTNGAILRIGGIILNWSPLGLFYRAFSGVMSWFGVQLPSKFTGFGSMIINGLINGISSKISVARNRIISFGQNIAGWFKSTLGIQSPSRVFIGFGENIAQGAALGIDTGSDQAIRVSERMAQRIAQTGKSNSLLSSGSAGFGTGSSSSITVHFSPNITISSSDANAVDQINQALSVAQREFEKRLEQIMADKARRSFNDGGYDTYGGAFS